MAEEIFINVTAGEMRVALLENSKLQEIYIERQNKQSLVGNIYKGRVSRIVPSMQAAFVDIGLERSAFLHENERVKNQRIAAGQELLVQVYKDPIGTKGARLTTQLAVPSRYLVFTPGLQKIQVSQRIKDASERDRLEGLLNPVAEGGYIFRTAAEGMSAEKIEPEQTYLQSHWNEIKARTQVTPSRQLVCAELSLELRVLRDLASNKVEKIYVDDAAIVKKMQEHAKHFMPLMEPKIEYYSEKSPIFDIYSVEKNIQALLARTVPLKSGGSIVIDQTEAMMTIDVNTGSYLGQHNTDETVFKTNLEAASAIAREVRLRNLGGIIIIDFIDMNDPSHRKQLLKALLDAAASDSARVEISEISTLGLVQMTRKRTRDSLEHALCDPCPTCQKRRSIKSIQTMCYDILRDIQRVDALYAWPGYVIQASHEIVDHLNKVEINSVKNVELRLDKLIKLQVEPSYGREQFKVLPL